MFVDRLDMATARAIQYARNLTPDELRVVHFAVDDQAAHELADEWRRLGLPRVPLDIVGVPRSPAHPRRRRSTSRGRSPTARPRSACSFPIASTAGSWHRILHDRTAEAFLADLSRLPHANVTTVPYQLDGHGPEADVVLQLVVDATDPTGAPIPPAARHADGSTVAIAAARWRDHVRIEGEVRSVRVRSQHDSPQLELVVADPTGAISLIFLGRRQIAGLHVGSRVAATATVGVFQNRLAMLNPTYELRPR